MRIPPPPHPDRVYYEFHRWTIRKAAELFVEMRKKSCDFVSTVEATVLVPICDACYGQWCHTFDVDTKPPDIIPDTWKEDLRVAVGLTQAETAEIEELLEVGADIGIHCRRCEASILYDKQPCYVESVSFAEYFDIPEASHRQPSKQLRKEVIELYGGSCYGCGRALTTKDISCDHIIARMHGGPTSIINLQLLCRGCNSQLKGSRPATVINVTLDFPFRPPPSDSYEGVVW